MTVTQGPRGGQTGLLPISWPGLPGAGLVPPTSQGPWRPRRARESGLPADLTTWSRLIWSKYHKRKFGRDVLLTVEDAESPEAVLVTRSKQTHIVRRNLFAQLSTDAHSMDHLVIAYIQVKMIHSLL